MCSIPRSIHQLPSGYWSPAALRRARLSSWTQTLGSTSLWRRGVTLGQNLVRIARDDARDKGFKKCSSGFDSTGLHGCVRVFVRVILKYICYRTENAFSRRYIVKNPTVHRAVPPLPAFSRQERLMWAPSWAPAAPRVPRDVTKWIITYIWVKTPLTSTEILSHWNLTANILEA